MDDKSSAFGLAGKILQNGGVLGLIAVMGVTFLMMVVYKGQQQLIDLSTRQIEQQTNQTRILTDIRFDIRATKGLTFRNDPQ